MFNKYWRILFLSIFVIGIFCFTQNSHAATIYASSSYSGTESGTESEPYNTFTEAYAAASSGDIIDLTGTFTWSDDDETGDYSTYETGYLGFEITKDITIQGQGADQTIVQSASSAYGSPRVFAIRGNASTTIKNMTIRHGYSSSAGTYDDGGCIYAQSGTNLTIENSDLHSCQTWGNSGHGGIIAAYSTTTIINSSIHSGDVGYDGNGAGIYFNASGKTLTIINSTIYDNGDSSLDNGGGIYVYAGTVNLTNTTVTDHVRGSGIYLYSSASVFLNLKNSIISGNTRYYNYNYAASNIYKGSSATVTSNGYNVMGDNASDAYFTATTGDWTDDDGNDTYDLYSIGTTGSLNLDTDGALNDNPLYTYTYRLLADSIAINNATTTVHNGVSIPNADQRSGTTNSTKDIGAFEYDAGGISVTEPITQATSITSSSVDYKQMTVSWTIGSGDRRVVFMKDANSGTATPVDGTSYTDSAVFGSGTQIGTTGWYAIYNGFGTSVNVTNLDAATEYIVQVFEYNGVGSSAEDYFTSTATDNPKVLASHTPITVYASSTYSGTENGTESEPYNTFTEAYNAAIAGDTIDVNGTFDWANTEETGDLDYSSWVGFPIEKDVTIQGHGADQTIFDGDTGRIFAIRENASTTIKSVTITNGYASGAGTYSKGGCIYVASGTNLTIDRSDIHTCRTHANSGDGGVIASYSTTTITNSSIHDANISYDGDGGGIYFNASGKTLNITNTTIYDNGGNELDYGGGIYIYAGTVNLTNSTVTGHTKGSGIYLYNSANAFLNLKNSIVSGNTRYYNYNYVASNIYKNSSATVTSDGYNVVGDNASDAYFTATTGDWTDDDGDDTYDLYSIGTTGSLNLDTDGALNDNPLYTYTYRLLDSSIAINNATTTVHGSVSIPSTDQRGGARSGVTDIGAFEYAAGGITVNEPTTQATSITSSSVDYKQMTVSWTIGGGDRRVVFMKDANSGTATPVDGTSYTDSAVFGSGTQIGTTGWYAIYNGFGTSVNVTNLDAATEYIVQVFEYNGVGSSAEDYFTSTATDNPKVLASHTPITIYANYTTGNDSNDGLTTSTPFKTFTQAYASATAGDTIDLTGTFTWTNADETGDLGYSSWVGFAIEKDLTIQGQGADETIVQAAETSSASTRIFAIRESASTTIKNITIKNGYTSSAGSYRTGGCIYSASGTNLTMDKVDIHTCRVHSSSGNGGVIAAYSTTTITNSSIHDANISYDGDGGGIYFNASGKTLNITNSTIYANGGNELDYGGGIAVYAGTTNITNSTITGHTMGGGIYAYNSASVFVNLKNSIVTGNTKSSSDYNFYKGSSATITSNGYNIVGDSSSDAYFTATTGDWTDDNGDDTYDLFSIGTTGSMNLDTSAGINSGIYGTYAYALLEDSIAINNATTTVHNGVAIPSLDQRGAGRNAATDIGAFEYEGTGLEDTTDPTMSSLSPLDDATGVGVDSTFTITFDEDIVTSTGNVVFYKTSDDSVVETIDIAGSNVTTSGSTALVINPSTTLDSEIEYYIFIAATAIDDTSGNSYAGITASTTWSFTTADVDSPTVTSISSDKTNGSYTTGEVIDIDIVFSEAVTSTGNITVTLETGDTDQTCTFSVTNATTGTCNYTVQAGDNSLDLNATLSGTITDDSSNSTTSLTASSALSTNKSLLIDTTNPTVTLSPLDEATDIAITSNLTMTFDEVVDAESGNITIYKTSDNSTIEIFDVTADITGSGTTAITINPASDLSYEIEYYVMVDATAFDDALSNSYAGITASTT